MGNLKEKENKTYKSGVQEQPEPQKLSNTESHRFAVVFVVQPASCSPARMEEEVFGVCSGNSRCARGHSRPTEMRKSHYGPPEV